jgi:hypothetical protein
MSRSKGIIIKRGEYIKEVHVRLRCVKEEARE